MGKILNFPRFKKTKIEKSKAQALYDSVIAGPVMDVDVKAFVAMGLSPEINLANAFRVSVAEDLQSYGIEITDAAGQVHKFQIQPNDFTEMAAALAAAFEHWKTGVKECLK